MVDPVSCPLHQWFVVRDEEGDIVDVCITCGNSWCGAQQKLLVPRGKLAVNNDGVTVKEYSCTNLRCKFRGYLKLEGWKHE